MKFLYLANIRIPTEKAHGVQIAKTCEALAKKELLHALVVTNRPSTTEGNFFTYYSLRTPYSVIRAKVIDSVTWGRIGFLLETFSFALSSLKIAKNYPRSIIYGRDEFVLYWFVLFSRQPLVWESHSGAWNYAARTVARRASHLVVISQGLKAFYVAHGVAEEKIIVAVDAIDPEDFADPETKEEARTRLGISPEKYIVFYAGRLDGWKGTDTLLIASTLLPSSMKVVIIGGEPDQIARFKEVYPGVQFLGAKPYAQLADNMAAADVLILPTSGKEAVGSLFTSPLKLFAYLTARKPIVASDVASNREILSDKEALFFAPDDPKSLAIALTLLTKKLPSEVDELTEAAHELSKNYTWDARAEILAHITQKT